MLQVTPAMMLFVTLNKNGSIKGGQKPLNLKILIQLSNFLEPIFYIQSYKINCPPTYVTTIKSKVSFGYIKYYFAVVIFTYH